MTSLSCIHKINNDVFKLAFLTEFQVQAFSTVGRGPIKLASLSVNSV